MSVVATRQTKGVARVVSRWGAMGAILIAVFAVVLIGACGNDVMVNYFRPQPAAIRLSQNSTITFVLSLKQDTRGSVSIHSQSGDLVRWLERDTQLEGNTEHSIPWNGRNDSGALVTVGSYYALFSAGSFRLVAPVVVLQ